MLRGPVNPARQNTTESLQECIEEVIDHGILRKVGHNEQEDVTTPVIMPWNIGKKNMVGDLRPGRFVYETLDNSSNIKNTMTVLSRNT
ncbi:hypothetical protein O181_104856 [Austropuccinia psidii MF-1]|uniref:Uncharacterized protein n=1 Tax=Austropuccinia psidii MF-1 TaxID=1389203 RepID=A0A9Q3JN14_9BASI|nr:hypothetical protein [Austropuccinia psidii MF-1]